MQFIYAPKNGEPQTFDFEPDDLLALEAEALEDAGGTQWRTFGQWVDLFNGGGFRAWRAALWIMLRRINPDLGFEEVLPTVGELMGVATEPAMPAAAEADEPGKGEPGDSDTSSP